MIRDPNRGWKEEKREGSIHKKKKGGRRLSYIGGGGRAPPHAHTYNIKQSGSVGEETVVQRSKRLETNNDNDSELN